MDKAFMPELWSDNDGQDVAEYGLIAMLISVIAVAAVKTFGTVLAGLWANIASKLPF